MAVYNLPSMRISAVDETTPAFTRAIGNIDRLNTRMGAANQAMNKSAGSMRMMRGGMNQMGYQIQDIAIQLQMGTNPFMVLSQQGSQIASLFGVGGAMIGAIGAIAGAIAMSLLPKLFDSKDAMDELKESADALDGILRVSKGGMTEFTDEAARMASMLGLTGDLQREIAQKHMRDAHNAFQQLLSDKFDLNKATLDEAAALREAGEELTAYNTARVFGAKGTTFEREYFKIGKSVREMGDEFGLSEEAILRLTGAINTANREPTADNFAAVAQAVELMTGDVTSNKDAWLENAEAILTAVDAANKAAMLGQGDVVELMGPSLADLEGGRSGLVKFRQKQHDHLKAMDEEELTAAKKKAAELAKIEREREASMNAGVGFMRQRLGFVKNALGEETKAGKAAFAAYQGIAIANAIVATHEAANKALAAGPYIGPILSAAALATGYASVGIMAAQTVASFEGGGMTPLGARAGGVDGRGGFTATLHPNEKVVDLDDKPDRAAAQTININLSALDTNGMERLLNENRGQIIDMVQESARMRGGRF